MGRFRMPVESARLSIVQETEEGAPPTLINDRYEVLRPLGRGGMGAVYLVHDRQEGRQVALKSFPPAARRVEDLAHFEHEFLTLSRLRNPNLAEVYDFGVIEGTRDVFFTSEFIDGEDLFAVSEGLDEDELAPLIVQTCRGLEYIHSRRIIHYDVKPSNIMVVGRGDEARVKLIDFGLAAERVEEALGVIKGTVSYLAPEVARHLPVDHRADLYSLGVTLFQCFTRNLPFTGETNLDVVRKILSDDPPDPFAFRRDLSRGLRDLILTLLAKDPGARCQSGNEVIRRLSKIYGKDYATAPKDESVHFVVSGGFIGREREFSILEEAFSTIFSWRDDDDPLADLPPALSKEDAARTPSGEGFVETQSGGFILELESGEFGFESTRPAILRAAPDGEDPSAAAQRKQPERAAQVFLVSGEAGVGKSRLLREFKTHAQLRRVAVVQGHASRSRGSYAAFAEAFRGVLALWSTGEEGAPLRLRQSDPLRRRLLQRYGGELARLIPELDLGSLPSGQRARLSPEEDELRLLDALAQFLIGYSRSRPLVVILHDLEEADRKTFELLGYLCRNLALIRSAQALRREGPGRTLRLMVIGSYRPSELSAEQETLLAELRAQAPLVELLELGPLDFEQTHALIESMLGVGSKPDALARRIYAETKGNPYFTVELMRALVEQERLVRVDGRWQVDLDGEDLDLPQNVADVILARLAQIGAEERELLEALAVFGRPSSLPELATLLEREARSLLPLLASLERRQVIDADAEEATRRYDFVHERARQAVYDAMQPSVRLRLHERCGEYLERRADLGLGTVGAGELVRHFAAAGDRARALDYGIRAGDEARAVHANRRALDYYGGALSLLPVGSSRWRELLVRTGELLSLLGDYERAADAYRRLLEPDLVERLRAEELVLAHRRLGESLSMRGAFDEALEALSQATATAYSADGLERESAGVFAVTASIYLQMGRTQDAIGFCEAGLGCLVGLSECAETARVRTVLGSGRLALGELSEAEREFERCLAIHRRLGDEAGVAQALRDLGRVSLAQGRLADAVQRLESSLELETSLGHSGGIALSSRLLAEACERLYRFDRAAGLLRRALSIHRKTGNRAEAVRTLVQLGRSRGEVGDYQEAIATLSEARAAGLELGLRAEVARSYNNEAALRARLGDVRGAEGLATEALRQASLLGDVPRQRAAALEVLGRVTMARGDLDVAEHHLTQAQTLYRKQEDEVGVARTVLSLVEIFLLRRDRELTAAGLSGVDEARLPDALRARLLLLRVRAALAFGELESKHLGYLERAAALGERARSRELGWRIAAARGLALERLGEVEGALVSFVEAMTDIRSLLEDIPPELRGRFLELPECAECRAEFSRLREQQRLGDAP